MLATMLGRRTNRPKLASTAQAKTFCQRRCGAALAATQMLRGVRARFATLFSDCEISWAREPTSTVFSSVGASRWSIGSGLMGFYEARLHVDSFIEFDRVVDLMEIVQLSIRQHDAAVAVLADEVRDVRNHDNVRMRLALLELVLTFGRETSVPDR